MIQDMLFLGTAYTHVKSSVSLQVYMSRNCGEKSYVFHNFTKINNNFISNWMKYIFSYFAVELVTIGKLKLILSTKILTAISSLFTWNKELK